MVIDFRCERCGKLLRAPAEASGRQSRCPECGNIQTVPSESTAPAAAVPGAFPAPPPTDNPFANPTAEAGYADPNNPYAAPVFDPRVASYAGAAPLTITRVDAGTILSASWALFRNNMGMIVLGFVVAFLMSMAIGMISSVPNGIAVATRADENVSIALQVMGNLVNNFFGAWVTLGLAAYLVKFARGQQPGLGDLLSAGLWQWVRYIVATIVMALMLMLLLAALAIPGGALMMIDSTIGILGLVLAGLVALPIYLLWVCALMLLGFLVADRNPPVGDILQTLYGTVRANFGTLLLLLLVNLAIVVLGVLALCIGLLIAAPFAYFIWTVAYLMMTGQPVGGAARVSPAQPAY